MLNRTKKLIAVSIILAGLVSAESVQAQSTKSNPADTEVESIVRAQTIVRLVKYPNPRPLPPFWDLLAKCETGGDWQNGGYFAGGLGIAQSTWKGYGGREFARTPAKATKEEQIIVANRIAVDGWQTNEFRTLADQQNNKPFFREPVGFNGWGALHCTGGKPALVAYEPSTVIAQKFKWGQTGRLVGDLQAILHIKQDFKYGAQTWAAHQRYIVKHGLDRSLVPSPRLKNPSRIPQSINKRCPQFEQLAIDAGFPKNSIQIVSYLMWKESRCVPTAVNAKDPSGGSRGLLQINLSWTEYLTEHGIITKQDDLLDPATNLKAGFYVFTYSIVHARYSYGWKPWSIW